jgi:serine-type D-Ala-D-Ala carboxypeptidase/endopeptidase (penicillin-binding protein 4)
MIIEFLTSGLLGFWLKTAGITEPRPPQPRLSFPSFTLQPADPQRDQRVRTYLSSLTQQGFSANNQGIWVQTEDEILVDHRGKQVQTPASLTKVATTLAALKTWGPKHQFLTRILTAGELRPDGILDGDLLIQSEGNPLLVTSEAITLGNQLNQLGLRKVTGHLILVGPLAVNFSEDLVTGGDHLKQIWNSSAWTPDVQQVYAGMAKGTPKPNLLIEGTAMEANPFENRLGKPFLTYSSLPLVDLLRFMNVYSHNFMAEWFADQLGGAAKIREIALGTERIVPKEIVLNNGSGLDQTNKLSPRAVVGLFQAIQAELQPHHLTLANLFPVMGQDKGTVEKRHMPVGTVLKTGTLWNTSCLAGVIETQKYGPVWFAVMNRGDDYTDGFRNAQDRFLQTLVQDWGADLVALPLPSNEQEKLDITNAQRRTLIDKFMQTNFLSH